MPPSQSSDLQPWDSDHTALVHVLWAAQRGGITISDPDVLAQHIMGSKWMRAVKEHASGFIPIRENAVRLPNADDL